MADERQSIRHPDDPELRGSLNDYREFLNHVCWRDIEEWVKGRIEIIQKRLETAPNMEEVRAHQESLKHMRDLLDIPHLFIEELENEEALKKENEEKTTGEDYE